ncbi:hypothetical protein NTD80_00480 [Pseudomonas sp. 13B_2.1_Bac1]|uniref:hypothetical protein n=1 Tax=Pseudomonas sp. 13B_2.1_Bac1 TaxID=2971624 RepID=UPI0021C7276F|nr:hypothetical protein [Pseudomonas sp. 13B_2.1_Bac1]MCU1781213.1 hypothetical protein [Pseudomonas sp. 13B_2.1_Bac1]
MTEPINLAPVRVHAISVFVQPPPDSIVGPAELLLQQGENGGVQIDAFWQDAMGNEIHESKEMQEEEYEALRAGYMRTEQATLPPFNSFKSGNTANGRRRRVGTGIEPLPLHRTGPHRRASATRLHLHPPALQPAAHHHRRPGPE